MKIKSILTAVVAGFMAWNASASVSLYAEYHLGEAGSLGTNKKPQDSSGNAKNIDTDISGANATVGTTGLSAPGSTACLDTSGTGNEGWYANTAIYSGLATDNMAFGIYASAAANTTATRGDVFILGGGTGAYKLSLDANGWEASANNVAYIGPSGGVSGSFTANTWVHLALIRSGGVTTLYINGVAQSGTYATAPVNDKPQFSVNPGGSTYFDGRLDEARVVTFTAGETTANILAVLQNGITTPGNDSAWTSLSGGSWTNSANWSGGTIASGTNHTANFRSLTLTGNTTVTLDGALTIGNLLFGDVGNTYGWTLNTGSAGPLTFAGSPSVITVSNQTAAISATIAGTGSLTKDGTGTLTLSGAGSSVGNFTLANGATTITGGGLTISGGSDATIGNTAAQNTTLTLNGGNMTYSSARLSVGTAANTTTVNLTSGTLSLANAVYIANTSGSSIANININGGTYSNTKNTAEAMAVGTSGSSTVTLSSGSVNLSAGGMIVGYTSGSTGVFNQSGGTFTQGGSVGVIIGNSSGSTGTVNLNGGTFTAMAIAKGGGTGNFNFNGGTLQAGASSASFMSGLTSAHVLAGGAVIDDGGNAITIGQALLAGAPGGGLTKLGSGTLTLGGASTYTGSTVVSNGTLALTGSLASTNIMVPAATTLDVSGVGAGYHLTTGETLQGLGTVVGPVTVDSGATLTVAGTTGTTVGSLTSSGNLTLNGNTVLRLSKTGGTPTSDTVAGFATLTYGGTLTVSNITTDANTLAVGDTFTLFPQGSGTYANSFAAFNLPALPGGFSWDTSLLSSSGQITVASTPVTAVPVFNPVAGGYLGAQTVTISCATPAVTIYYTTDGTTPNNTSPSGASGLTVSVPNNATLTIHAYAHTNGWVDSPVNSATYATASQGTWSNLAGGSWAGAGNWMNGIIASGSGITADFSTLTMTANTTVTLGAPETIGRMLFADQGGTYNWTLSGSGPLTLDAGASQPVISVANTNTTIATVLAGTNGLIKNGVGTLTLTTANSYTGSTVISNGTLQVGNGGTTGALGAGDIVDQGTLAYSYNSSTTLSLPSGSALTGSGSLTATAGVIQFNGNLGLGGSQTIAQNGGVTASLYKGLELVATNTTLTASALTLTGDVGKRSADGGSLTLDTSAANGAIDLNISLGRSNVWYLPASFTANAGSGTINVTGTGPASSGWRNTPVTLAGAVNLTADVSCASNVTINATAPGSVSGVLSGGMSLTKTGNSTLTLTAANTYTGNTMISAGTLELDGSLASAAIAINGGTLDGTGYIAGAVTVQSGGTLAAGTAASMGTLTISGTLGFGAGSTNAMRIDKQAGPALTSDLLAGMAGATYGGTLKVTATGDTLAAGDTFYLFSGSGYSGTFAHLNLPVLPAGLSWDVSGLLSSGSITVSANAATPVFNPPGGNYIFAGPMPVTITSETGATIHYTTDGSDPTTSGTVLSGASPVTVTLPANTASLTITAYAVKSGEGNSANVSATYTTIDRPTWINPNSDSWSGTYNWSNNFVANGIGMTADFTTLTLTADTTVTLDTPATVGHLVFGDQGNAFNWILADGGAGALTLDNGTNLPVITVVNTNTTIAAVLAGTSGLVKDGAGHLTLNGASTVSGATVAKTGILEVLSRSGDQPYVVTNGGTLEIGYTTAGGYANTGMKIYGDGAAATTGFYLAGGQSYNCNGQIQLLGAPTTIRQYGTGLAGIGMFDINGNGLWCSAAASGSAIDANVQMISRGYGMSATIDAGANTATGDLVINGPLNAGALGFYKRGGGSVRLNGAASAGNVAVQVKAGSVICGTTDCLGTTATVPVSAGATLDLNGFSQTVSSVSLGGALKMNLNQGGTPNCDVLTVTDGNPLTLAGTLTVTNGGGTLAGGDTFTLFSASGGITGDFTATNLPALGAGLAWNWTPASGVLSVIATGPSGPASIASSVSGGTLNLTWPAGQGWRLVSQTNSLSTGLGSTWGTVPGVSDGSAAITIDPAKPTVFYKLVFP